MTAIDLHPLLADRNRLLIMSAIATATHPVDFVSLLGTLKMTRGNLASHLRKLEEAGLILMHKEFVERIPRTTYRCSQQGRKAVRLFLKSVEQLLKDI